MEKIGVREMKKQDLKDGMILETRNGKRYLFNDREIEIIKALKTLGYEWLARDYDDDDALYVFTVKPERKNGYKMWFDSGEEHYFFPIKEKELFNFIEWEDDEPTNIDDLLKGVRK